MSRKPQKRNMYTQAQRSIRETFGNRSIIDEIAAGRRRAAAAAYIPESIRAEFTVTVNASGNFVFKPKPKKKRK